MTVSLWGTTWITMFVLCCCGCCGSYNTEYERTWREPPKPDKKKKKEDEGKETDKEVKEVAGGEVAPPKANIPVVKTSEVKITPITEELEEESPEKDKVENVNGENNDLSKMDADNTNDAIKKDE